MLNEKKTIYEFVIYTITLKSNIASHRILFTLRIWQLLSSRMILIVSWQHPQIGNLVSVLLFGLAELNNNPVYQE